MKLLEILNSAQKVNWNVRLDAENAQKIDMLQTQTESSRNEIVNALLEDALTALEDKGHFSFKKEMTMPAVVNTVRPEVFLLNTCRKYHEPRAQRMVAEGLAEAYSQAGRRFNERLHGKAGAWILLFHNGVGIAGFGKITHIENTEAHENEEQEFKSSIKLGEYHAFSIPIPTSRFREVVGYQVPTIQTLTQISRNEEVLLEFLQKVASEDKNS